MHPRQTREEDGACGDEGEKHGPGQADAVADSDHNDGDEQKAYGQEEEIHEESFAVLRVLNSC